MNTLLQFLCLISILIFAQQADAQVTFNEQQSVKQLMDYWTSQHRSEPTIEGWRIKIISTTDRRALESAKSKFDQYYTELTCVQNYEAPYYSLKYGAFETRLDLEPMLVQFKQDFPNAIPFRDKILKSELFD